MPFTNREVAVILASELNRHDPGLWFYRVERHIDNTSGKAASSIFAAPCTVRRLKSALRDDSAGSVPDKLAALRGEGESYNDVMRLAAVESSR